jgi:tetratricopeptide (TPR) repeat protein
MHAVISGRAGRALLIDRGSLKSFDVDDPSNFVPRQQSDLPYLFGETQDLRVIENSDVESVQQELKRESDSDLALDLTLISLDADLPQDIRTEAIEGLDDLLTDNQVVETLENTLYACPLPEDGDLVGAIKLGNEARSSNVVSLLTRFEERQALIYEVSEAWEAIPGKVFRRDEERVEFQHVAVREGFFRKLVIFHEARTPERFLLEAGLNISIKHQPSYRQVLQCWVSPFRQGALAPKIKHELEEESQGEISLRRRHGRRTDINRSAVLREVNRRKAIIVRAMNSRDVELVHQLVDSLASYQLENGETEHAAKSLCDLAMEAKSLGMFHLQLELTERSIGIAPGDGWSWAQYADALLKTEQLNDALRAYEQADSFRAGVISKIGRAEVLKAQGQLPAALAAFDEVIKQHPENVVAKTGRAEVLKAQGQLPAALAAFDEVIKQHPENVFAKTGRAEVLKAQGQLPAALAAFDEVIKQHPENVVARNGRAEVLKAQGQLPAALAAFDEVIKQHPENVFAKTGRAEVLKAQGQLPAALAAFDEVIKQHPENVVAKTGRAEVLKAEGQLPAALAAFDEVIKQHPEDVVARNGRAEVLKAQGQLPAALAAFDEVIKQHPEDVFAKTGRAEVLKAQGQLPAALAAFDEVIKQHPEDVVARNGRSCVLAGLRRYDEALADLPNKIPETLGDWIGFHIRGMIMLRKGNIDEAIRIFQRGAKDDPIPLSKQYFHTALSVALMRHGEYWSATKVLSKVEAPELQPQVSVLLTHCYGENNQAAKAIEAYESISAKPWSISNELIEELHRRYVLGQPPQRSNDWVFDQEIASLLVVANQQTPISNYLF